MKLRKVEDKELFPIEDLFIILVKTLKDYIPVDKSTLDEVLEDWKDTVDSNEGQSIEDIPIKIPVKLDQEIDFSLSKNVGCEIPSGFEVTGEIHLYGVAKDHYYISVILPSITTLLDYFCGNDRTLGEDYPFEEEIRNLNQAQKFADDVKAYLDSYTDNLKSVYDSLKKMNDVSYNIWKVINEGL